MMEWIERSDAFLFVTIKTKTITYFHTKMEFYTNAQLTIQSKSSQFKRRKKRKKQKREGIQMKSTTTFKGLHA